MTNEPKQKRKEKDHERYLRERDKRLKRWHDYYDMNRENILLKKRSRGVLKWNSIKTLGRESKLIKHKEP